MGAFERHYTVDMRIRRPKPLIQALGQHQSCIHSPTGASVGWWVQARLVSMRALCGGEVEAGGEHRRVRTAINRTYSHQAAAATRPSRS